MDTNDIQPLLDEQRKLLKEFKDLKAALMEQVHQIRGFHEDAKRNVNDSRRLLDNKVVMLVETDSDLLKKMPPKSRFLKIDNNSSL